MTRALVSIAVCGVLACGVLACGDARSVEQQFEPTSGTRLKLEQYLYEDGTRQVDPSAFYDTRLHTRCAVGPWPASDVLRCVPIAERAVFTDDTCTEVVGIVGMVESEIDRDPTHFIGDDWIDDERTPARLYSAGPQRSEPLVEYYERRDGACTGPLSAPTEATFYTITEELPASAMAAMFEDELGGARLGLKTLASDDGMVVATGVRDRMLDATCVPTTRGDGTACEPAAASTTGFFADSACTTPVITTGLPNNVPTVARVDDAAGCATYFSVGGELDAPLYYRNSDTCVRLPSTEGIHAYALGSPIELPWLERSVSDGDGAGAPVAVTSNARRLQRVILEDPADPTLRFDGNAFVDRALRAECRLEPLGETQRCLPATAGATTVYTTGCAAPIHVVEHAERTCMPFAFAMTPTEDGTNVELRAIGDRMAMPMYRFGATGCVPYVPAEGRVVRSLGPPIPAEAFVGAVKYGER